VYVDDATSRLMALHFTASESTFSYFEATRAYLERYGKPVAFYSDPRERGSAARVRQPPATASRSLAARCTSSTLTRGVPTAVRPRATLHSAPHRSVCVGVYAAERRPRVFPWCWNFTGASAPGGSKRYPPLVVVTVRYKQARTTPALDGRRRHVQPLCDLVLCKHSTCAQPVMMTR